jgi:tRNA pseudouridine38/39 synthase
MNYASLSKEQLILRLIQLEKRIDSPVQKPFDFNKTKCRKVAFRLAYIGTNYFGFTGLPSDPLPTIEGQLMGALMKMKLVPGIEECGWSRCGRTDKGVSAFGQVVSLWIRTKNENGIPWDQIPKTKHFDNPYFPTNESEMEIEPQVNDVVDIEDEIPYCSMLNRLLPSEIRILGWTPVPHTFDARFSCTHRSYKYFFHSKGFNIPEMQKAASHFVGTHDFRHFCKLEPTKLHEEFFTRTIFESEIVQVNDSVSYFFVKGRAFLWHQVRNMMAVLFMVGQKKESPSIVSKLLDLSLHPPKSGKPQYEMAPDKPLCLVDCGFENITWHQDSQAVGFDPTLNWIKSQTEELELSKVQLLTLEAECQKMGMQPSDKKEKQHVPIMKRKRCDSVEDLQEKQQRKK